MTTEFWEFCRTWNMGTTPLDHQYTTSKERNKKRKKLSQVERHALGPIVARRPRRRRRIKSFNYNT